MPRALSDRLAVRLAAVLSDERGVSTSEFLILLSLIAVLGTFAVRYLGKVIVDIIGLP